MKGKSIRNIAAVFFVLWLGGRAFAQDPFDDHPVMPAGPFAGQAIDTSERRSIRVLTPAEAAPYSPAPGEIVIANFYHWDPRYPEKFWVAKVPADAVQETIFESWNFSWLSKNIPVLRRIPTAAHNEIRFRLKPGKGITLYPQDGSGPPLDRQISDFVFSVEAVGPKGVPFGFTGGLNDHFVAAHRLKSIEESFFERVMRDKEHVKQYRLNLDEKTNQELLKNAILVSDAAGMHTMYHLFKRSCTTEAYRLIDRTLHYGPLASPMRSLHRIPVFPYTYLRLRGLIDRRSRLKTLNEEGKPWRERYRERVEALLEKIRADREAARLALGERAGGCLSWFRRVSGS